MSRSWEIGIDTGGTFTDITGRCRESAEVRNAKVWSETGDPAGLIAKGIADLNLEFQDVISITYGTTRITNALVEHKLDPVVLVTTEGFGDVLTIARQKREPAYDITLPHRTPSPVHPENIVEVPGRMSYQGEIVEPMESDILSSLPHRMPAPEASVAVSLLHSYADGTMEIDIGQALRPHRRYVALSHEVSRESREYERGLTTVLTAGLLRTTDEFISALMSNTDLNGRLSFFHSAGGLVAPETVLNAPLMLAMSGPAAGVLASARIARSLNIPLVVTLDMGGTTTDCGVIENGQASITTQSKIGSYSVQQPMIAIASIGAGGGSILSMSEGRIHVGPQSAGASPGPACYGRGGTSPTLTDAAAILGYFGDARLKRRKLTVDTEAARAAFKEIVTNLSGSPEDCALGTIQVSAAIAARSVMDITMQKGINPRDCTLMAYGGAGPMFAAFIAQELGLDRIVVPANSGTLSATGCRVAQPSSTRQITLNLAQEDATPEVICAASHDLANSIRAALRKIRMPGGPEQRQLIALMRYTGQSHEIEVPFEEPVDLERLTADLSNRHQALYGFEIAQPWILVSLRVTVSVPQAAPGTPPIETEDPHQEILASVECYFADTGWTNTPQLHRRSLSDNDTWAGPALIIDGLSTIVVPPGFSARAMPGRHIQVARRGAHV